MLAILNYLNAHNFPIFRPILMILVSKFMVHRAFSDKIYLSLGLLSLLTFTLLRYEPLSEKMVSLIKIVCNDGLV